MIALLGHGLQHSPFRGKVSETEYQNSLYLLNRVIDISESINLKKLHFLTRTVTRKQDACMGNEGLRRNPKPTESFSI